MLIRKCKVCGVQAFVNPNVYSKYYGMCFACHLKKCLEEGDEFDYTWAKKILSKLYVWK